MTLFLACNDTFRNCTPPEEYFHFGLWFPPEEHGKKLLETKGPGGLGKRQPGVAGGEGAEGEDGEFGEGGPGSTQGEDAALQKAPSIVVAPEIINAQKKEFEDKFGGKATVSQVGDQARAQGFAPSQGDLALLAQKQETLTYDEYTAFLKEISHPEDSEDHLAAFFKSYDTANSGTLTLQQVKNLLMNFGEPLTSEEVDCILKQLDMHTNVIDYTVLSKKLLDS